MIINVGFFFTRPSPKLRKYTDGVGVKENALLSCQSTEKVLKPSQLTYLTIGYNRCKDRKKPLVPRLDNLIDDTESSNSGIGFILSPQAERPYKCNFCGKQFKYFSNLKSHMKIVHKKMVESSPKDRKDSTVGSGQVFQCEICFRNFKYFSNLRTHSLVHTSSELNSVNS